MVPPLRCADDDLEGLAEGRPALIDATSGEVTGIRLLRRLGAGGMSTVFLAELDAATRSAAVSPLAPPRLVVKFTKPSIERQLARLNLGLLDIAQREATALQRVMGRSPPTEFIISMFGSGSAEVAAGGGPARKLPWIALEFIDGGSAGATLADRVQRAHDGIDPVRALRLARGMIEGAGVFHELDIVHRDLKPENVFTTGPIDEETPKLADCGIARVEGFSGGTIAGLTPEYGGPEQVLSAIRPHVRNPLVGPWTDVHALAATIWFVLAGESWYRAPTEWDAGVRRSLRTARRLHRGLMEAGPLLDAIDETLRRGAAPRLPACAWEVRGAGDFEGPARKRFATSMFGSGAPRYASAAELGQVLLPLLEECAARWTERAARENRPVTQFRPTLMFGTDATKGARPPADAEEIAGLDSWIDEPLLAAQPGGAVCLPGSGWFVRFGQRILYLPYAGGRPAGIDLPDRYRSMAAASPWLVRGPGKGIALVGPSHVLLIRRGDCVVMPQPRRPAGGEVGEIQAVISERGCFGVVTAETDDSNGGLELWRSIDGSCWTGPSLLPLGGDAHALAYGPFGLLVVGSRGGKRARALFQSLDEQIQVFAAGVNDKPPLRVAVSGGTREAWAAGQAMVLRFDPSGAARESAEIDEPPVAMKLDLQGIPWLLTEHVALRRHDDGGSRVWKPYYARSSKKPPFVAIDFAPEGARIVDAQGGGALVKPHDMDAWA